MKKALLLILFFLAIATQSYAICDFTVSKTTVCAGEEVTIILKEPTATFHNIIVYNGIFPFGSNANSNDYSVVFPYELSDNIIKIKFRGRNTIGTYTILLAEDNNNNNPQIPCGQSVKITVNPSPDPEITELNNFNYCSSSGGKTISIANASTTKSNISIYTIDWGDGISQSDPTFSSPIAHTYASNGSYTVKVTVTSNFPAPCNTATKEYQVRIGISSPIYSSSSQFNLECVPYNATVVFKLPDMATNPSTTIWKIYINGSLDTTFTQATLPNTYSHLFLKGSCGSVSKDCSPDPDLFSIKVVGNTGCGINSVTKYCFPVNDSIKPRIKGRDTVCLNEPTTYINDAERKEVYVIGDGCRKNQNWTITPASGYNFTNTNVNNNVYNEQDLNITFTQKGRYRIKLSVDGGCNSKDTFKDIIVVDRITALAEYIAPNCIPAVGFVDIPFTNKSFDMVDIIGYQWSINPSVGVSFVVGSANTKETTVRFAKSGSYDVTLQAFGGCNNDTWDSTIVIKGKPAIDTLKIPEGCSAPYIFNPKNYFNYTNGGDPNAIFSWAFPDGVPATANIENPGNITYINSGIFPIGLNISAECGDSTLTNFVKVNNNVKPDAGRDINVCKFSGQITLTAVPAGGVWRGNGIVDSVLGIFKSSTVPTGSYDIVYVLNPTGNCPTKDTIKINIVEIIGLTAGPDQTICKGSGVLQLIGNPNFPNGSWFGNGVVNNTVGIFDPIGLVPGFYQVGYIYSDISGSCKDTAYKKVTVFDSVHVTLPPPVLCINQAFNFGNLVGNLTIARWNFGDGTPDAFVTNPTHIFTRTGTFIVTLFAETPDRCLDTIKIPITVTSNPPLSFIINPDSSCTGNNISFTFPVGHDTATNYIWDFGSSSLQTNVPSPQLFSFPQPLLKDSLYFVTLRADYFCGPSFFTDTVKVKAKPKANFGIQNIGCSPFTPVLANTSYGSPITFLWNFGNGSTTSFPDPIAPTYVNTTRRDTSYKIKLSVSNACGSDTITKSITVKGNDIFAKYFTDISQGCQPLEVNFFNLSSPSADIIWDFGDGTSAYADNVSHIYDSSGTYKAKIYARGSCGIDSFTTTINVFGKPKPAFTYTPACVNAPTQFLNNTTNGNSYIWYFGDGDSSISTKPNPTHIYTTTGAYVVKLIVANARPCVDSISIPIRVSTKPKAEFTVAIPKVCEQEPSVFINNSELALNYVWSFGNGESSIENQPQYVYPKSGLFNVTLTAINGDCKDSITKFAAVEIYPKPIAGFTYDFLGNGFNAPVQFSNTTFNGNTFFWTFGDGDTSNLKEPGSHQYDGEGPYRVTLYTVSNKGCKDTISQPLGVDYTGQVYVPNVFSPEVGIGESAIWKPKGLAMKEYHVEVFSTYGQLLWESSALENGQPSEGWDGRLKGVILPQDVYVWKIRAIFTDGKAWLGMKDSKTGKRAIMGSILLLR